MVLNPDIGNIEKEQKANVDIQNAISQHNQLAVYERINIAKNTTENDKVLINLDGHAVNAVVKSGAVENAQWKGGDYEKQLKQEREAFFKSINTIMDKVDYISNECSYVSVDAKRILSNRGHKVSWDNIFTYLNGVNSRRSNSEFRSDTRKDFPGDAQLLVTKLNVAKSFFSKPQIINVINMDCFAKEREKIVKKFTTMFNDPVVGKKAMEALGPAASNIKGMDIGLAISNNVESTNNYVNQLNQVNQQAPVHNLSIDQTASQLMCGLHMTSNGNLNNPFYASLVKNGNTVTEYNLGSNVDNLHSNMMETAQAIVMNRPDLKSVSYTLGQDAEKDKNILGRLQEAQQNVREAVKLATKGGNGEISVDASFTKFVGNYARQIYNQKISRNLQQMRQNAFVLKTDQQNKGMER